MYRLLLVLVAGSCLAQTANQKQAGGKAPAKADPIQALVNDCRAKLSTDAPAAEGCFRTVLKRAPNSAALHQGLGQSLEKQNKLDEAEGEFLAAVKLEPANQTWEISLIDLLVTRKAVDRVAALAPGLEEKFSAASAFPAAYGWALTQRRQIEAARVQYRKAAGLSRYPALYYRQFAKELADLGEIDEAIRTIREKAQVEALTITDRYFIAELRERQKLWEEAVAEYLAVGSAFKVEQLAERLAAEGDADTAIRLYKDIVDSPQFSSLAFDRFLALLQEKNRWGDLTATCAEIFKKNEFQALPCGKLIKSLVEKGSLDQALQIYGTLANREGRSSFRVGITSSAVSNSARDLFNSLAAAHRWDDVAQMCKFGDGNCLDLERQLLKANQASDALLFVQKYCEGADTNLNNMVVFDCRRFEKELFLAGRTREAVTLVRGRAERSSARSATEPDFALSIDAEFNRDLRLEDHAALALEATRMRNNGYHLEEFLRKSRQEGKLSEVAAALMRNSPGVEFTIKYDGLGPVQSLILAYQGYFRIVANKDIHLLGRYGALSGLTVPQGGSVVLSHPFSMGLKGMSFWPVDYEGATWLAEMPDFHFIVNVPTAEIRPFPEQEQQIRLLYDQAMARIPVDASTVAQERPLDEITLGINAHKTILSQHSLYEDPAAAEVGSRAFRLLMGTPTALAGDVKTYQLTLLNESEANAYSTAGGHIYVTSRMIGVIGNDVGLWAAVIAHEAGHIVAHHQYKQYVRQIQLKLTRDLLRQQAANGNKVATWAWLISVGGGQALSLKLNRNDELEADRLGILMMAQAGIHPDYALALMARLKGGTGDRGRLATFLSSDHPRWETREKKTKQVYEQALRTFQQRWADPSGSPGGAPPKY